MELPLIFSAVDIPEKIRLQRIEIIFNATQMKQNKHSTQFIKEPEEETRDYIFQKNTKTKIGTYIVIGFLTLLVIGIIVSAMFFGSPEA